MVFAGFFNKNTLKGMIDPEVPGGPAVYPGNEITFVICFREDSYSLSGSIDIKGCLIVCKRIIMSGYNDPVFLAI